jgi:hypothetical protein
VAAAASGIWSVFAKRHHQAFDASLDLELPKAPCDSTFLYLFERVELEQLFGLLRDWMLTQIADRTRISTSSSVMASLCEALPLSSVVPAEPPDF